MPDGLRLDGECCLLCCCPAWCLQQALPGRHYTPERGPEGAQTPHPLAAKATQSLPTDWLPTPLPQHKALLWKGSCLALLPASISSGKVREWRKKTEAGETEISERPAFLTWLPRAIKACSEKPTITDLQLLVPADLFAHVEQNHPSPCFLRLLVPALSPEKVVPHLRIWHSSWSLRCPTPLSQVTPKGCSWAVGLSCWWAEHNKSHMHSKSQTWPGIVLRQCAWCDKSVSYPKHTQLLSESGESEQPTQSWHSPSNHGAAARSHVVSLKWEGCRMQVLYLFWSLKELCHLCSHRRSRNIRISHASFRYHVEIPIKIAFDDHCGRGPGAQPVQWEIWASYPCHTAFEAAFFTTCVVNHWTRLPIEVVDAPLLKTFKINWMGLWTIWFS